MKSNTIKAAIILLIILIVAGILNAEKPKGKVVDDMDLIIEKSNQTMREAAKVSQKADQVVVEQVKEMKQTIEVLEVERESLVQQVKVMYNEMESIKSAPLQSFDVLAILPDSTGGGE